jgi:hypothetical protein
MMGESNGNGRNGNGVIRLPLALVGTVVIVFGAAFALVGNFKVAERRLDEFETRLNRLDTIAANDAIDLRDHAVKLGQITAAGCLADISHRGPR